jgi:23S rRNA (pseudouridine1915-N3)-methyltransferase
VSEQFEACSPFFGIPYEIAESYAASKLHSTSMKVLLAAIRKGGSDGEPNRSFSAAARVYLERIQKYVDVDAQDFSSERALVAAVEKLRTRTPPLVVLLDGRGKSFSSEELAGWIGRQRDTGIQNLIFAIGPADGWSENARAGTGLMLSLGPMTLPHELARVVLAEQVYRAFTILAGHPYHRE